MKIKHKAFTVAGILAFFALMALNFSGCGKGVDWGAKKFTLTGAGS